MLSKVERVRLENSLEYNNEIIRRRTEPVNNFTPYDKQLQFFESGVKYAESCLMAGNQCGKTLAACMEVYYHATGRYPEWWPGAVFKKAPVIWVCGETSEVIRDTTNKYLTGRPGELEDEDVSTYTGLIPKRYILAYKKISGGNGSLDYLVVKHKTGKKSYIFFKAYARGREKFQGDTVDIVFFDEEPPESIYSEGITRTNKGQLSRFARLTFTPLKGMSTVVYSFLKEPTKAQKVVNMTINDVDHYTHAEKEAIVAGYPEHEREARAKGIPIMGSGRVYAISEARIKEKRIHIVPPWWRMIGGLDFGMAHPMAAVMIYLDPDVDCIHVRRTFKESDTTPLMFAQAIKDWDNLFFAWPRDGLQRDKGSGKQLSAQFRAAGINMFREPVCFDDGTVGVEAGIAEITDRMLSGRFKVDESLTDWFDEFRLYHRQEGIIVKIRDDLMDATRYAIMYLRFAAQIKEQLREDDLVPIAVNDW